LKFYINRLKERHLYMVVALCLIIVLAYVYAEYVSAGSVGPKPVISEEFKVSIVLSYEIPDLYAWQAVVAFNPNAVLVLNVENGGFLSSNSLTFNSSSLSPNMNGSQQLNAGDSLFITSYDDIELGKLVLAETKIGNVPGTTGSGTLVTITFGVFGKGSYDIRLLDNSLLDSKMNSIKQVFLTSPTKIS